MEEKSKVCKQCGGELEADAKLCSHCGMMIPPDITEKATVEAEEVASTPWYEENNQNNSTYNNTYHNNDTPAYDVNKKKNNMEGTSIASLVCGILSLLCCCVPYFGIILSIAAIVLGIISIKNGYAGKNLAIAGICCGAVSIVIRLLLMVLGGIVGLAEYLDYNTWL